MKVQWRNQEGQRAMQQQPPNLWPILLKYIRANRWLSLAFRFYKIEFRPGVGPEPRWGSLWRSSKSTSRLGREIPILTPHPSLSTTSASRLGALVHLFSVYLGAIGTKRRTLEIPPKPNFWIRPRLGLIGDHTALYCMQDQYIRPNHQSLRDYVHLWPTSALSKRFVDSSTTCQLADTKSQSSNC